MKSGQICGRYTKQDLNEMKHKRRWTIQTPPNFSIDFHIKTSCQSSQEKKENNGLSHRGFKSYKVPREVKVGIEPWATQTVYRESRSVMLPKPCFCVLCLNLTTEHKKT